MDHSEKNKWIDEVMDSLDGMQRVSPRGDMYEHVVQRIRSGGGVKTGTLVARIAAAAVLLLAINIASVYHASKANVTRSQGVYQSVDEQISNLSDGSY